MRDVGFTFGERDAVELTLAGEGEEASAGYGCVAPVVEGEGEVCSRREGEGLSRPGEERGALEEGPVGGAVEVKDAEGGLCRGSGDQSGVGRVRGDAMVEEGYA